MRRCPARMEIAAVLDEGRKLRRAVGDRERLRNRREPQRRQRRDLARRSTAASRRDRCRGWAQARKRRRSRGRRRLRGWSSAMAARCPPADQPDTMIGPAPIPCFGPSAAEPVERAADFADDLRQRRIRRERVAGQRHRPAMSENAFGEAGEILARVALPVAAVDEHEARRRGRACRQTDRSAAAAPGP